MSEDDDAPALPAAGRTRLAPTRKAVVNRLWRAAALQLAAHEARLSDLPSAGASEADAKALATLARTVRELVALESAPRPGESPADELSPAQRLARVAGLRAGLARRLEALAAERTGGAGQGAASGSEC